MLALDASTKKTGYAVFENGKLKDYGLIDLSEEKSMDSRMPAMTIKILQLLALYPDVIYIEETAVVRNAATQRFLTRLQGVVYGWAIKNDSDFNTIRPNEWRSLVGIKCSKKSREELKKESIKKVEELFNITTNEDTAEAILIGQAAINKYN